MDDRYEGGDLLVEALLQLGVKQIFSVSGGPINSIYHAAASHHLPLIHARHEQGAGFMADATAKVTGVPGVAAVTLGPATASMVTNALMAKMSGTPMLIVGGQGALGSFDRDAEMMADGVRIMTPVTKMAARVLETRRIPEYVEMAWRAMWAGRPGPAFLEIPMDVLSAPAERQAMNASPPPRGSALSAKTADQISAALERAERPLLIIGDEAYWELYHDLDPSQLRAAVERHGLLFTSLRHARGVIDERHWQCCGPGCAHANGGLRKAMAEADLIFLLGHHMESDLDFGEPIREDCIIIQSYPDPAYHGKGRHADIATTAGVAAIAAFLLELTPIDNDALWGQSIAAAWRAERLEKVSRGGGANQLHPAIAVDVVAETMPDDTIFACGAGNVDFWVDERIQARAPGTHMKGGLGGGLGADIPYGLAARLADPDRPVVVFVGDGGIGYHGFELDTAARYGQPIIVVVLDDRKWGCIAVPQRQAYGAEFEMDLPERDWPGLARALGGFGVRAESEAELREAVKTARRSGKPAIIHVSVGTVLSPFMEQVGH